MASKTPEIFVVRVAGDQFADRRAFALAAVGTEVSVDQLTSEGQFLDVIGVTKGFGFQGHIQRFQAGRRQGVGQLECGELRDQGRIAQQIGQRVLGRGGLALLGLGF